MSIQRILCFFGYHVYENKQIPVSVTQAFNYKQCKYCKRCKLWK